MTALITENIRAIKEQMRTYHEWNKDTERNQDTKT